MSSLYPVETIESHGCVVSLRRLQGPDAQELFFNCKPSSDLDPAQATETVYRAILSVLDAQGGDLSSVVSENIFIRDMAQNLASVRAGRSHWLKGSCKLSVQSALNEIEQPPLNHEHCLEVLIQAVIPNSTAAKESYTARTSCNCSECAGMRGLRLSLGKETRFYAGALYGAGDNSYEQTLAMFGVAEDLLKQAGMSFRDVMRTWIYFPMMERDYDGFNLARREFFYSRNIDPIPASTGIGAGLVPHGHDLSLGIYAVKSDPPPPRAVMVTPTLNEAPEYGSDFSRGMRVEEANKTSILVSGTASIDETGNTVYLEDLDKQADRTLMNVRSLLTAQGADFKDIAYAITYLKHPNDAQRIQEIFDRAGYTGFPNVIVKAPVCRPDLLCETELLALLPA